MTLAPGTQLHDQRGGLVGAPTSGPSGACSGMAPRWSRHGDLVYQSGDQILAARYTVNGEALVPDKPRVWIATIAGSAGRSTFAAWDLAPDGTRILALVPVADARAASTPDRSFVFLQNFFGELRRRAPLPQ